MSDKTTKTESPALAHCGYRVEEDAPGGLYELSVQTPFEGASVEAAMGSRGGSGRVWGYRAGVRNDRGIGWTVSGSFENCGRYVAKSLLRTLALELRRAYCHRGKKRMARAIARAIARREAEEAGHA